MKANRLASTLLLVVAVAAHLPAQQTEADPKLLAEIRAKAEKGDTQSQSELGATFFFGNLGVPRDEVEAVKWYRKAAEQNDAWAQYNLGFCHASGRGVAKDYVEAVKWWRKAAEQNDPWAQNNLGVCYANGDGFGKDYVQTRKWWILAAAQGHAGANKALSVIEPQMRKEEISEAHRLAREFRPSKAPETTEPLTNEQLLDSRPLRPVAR